jgi:2-succinyl-5-enolpyruvyl-6-hydroxy-3-cyclohexene-1-carboxylate synthase
LTIGFVSNPAFTCYSIADERSAAFFALGIAQQTKHPVALVCTSGSALLNYYPALAERHSQIPMIVFQLIVHKVRLISVTDKQSVRKMYSKNSLYNANLDEVVSLKMIKNK